MKSNTLIYKTDRFLTQILGSKWFWGITMASTVIVSLKNLIQRKRGKE